MAEFAWGLIGPGGIANRFAEAVVQLPGMHLRSVLGRDPQRVADFIGRWSRDGQPAPVAAGDIDSLLADDGVDAVYIATPHSLHFDMARRCLDAGKPVLCEKPLVPTAAAARELIALARARRVFLMEALWTRYLPVYGRVEQWLRSGAIGPIQALQSSFCFPARFDPRSRLFDPSLAGGAVLDIGVYGLSMSSWALQAQRGQAPEVGAIAAGGVLSDTGVDQRVWATLQFTCGAVSQIVCGLDGCAANTLEIFGARGAITVRAPFWAATEAVLRRPDEPDAVASAPWRINGFEGEIEEAVACIRAGQLESPRMPHDETLATLACADEIRRQLGVRYPFEPPPVTSPGRSAPA